MINFSSVSATTLLGGPTDVYLNGTMYLWLIVSAILCVPVASHVYMPIFHRLQIVSANQVCFPFHFMWAKLGALGV